MILDSLPSLFSYVIIKETKTTESQRTNTEAVFPTTGSVSLSETFFKPWGTERCGRQHEDKERQLKSDIGPQYENKKRPPDCHIHGMPCRKCLQSKTRHFGSTENQKLRIDDMHGMLVGSFGPPCLAIKHSFLPGEKTLPALSGNRFPAPQKCSRRPLSCSPRRFSWAASDTGIRRASFSEVLLQAEPCPGAGPLQTSAGSGTESGEMFPPGPRHPPPLQRRSEKT